MMAKKKLSARWHRNYSITCLVLGFIMVLIGIIGITQGELLQILTVAIGLMLLYLGFKNHATYKKKLIDENPGK